MWLVYSELIVTFGLEQSIGRYARPVSIKVNSRLDGASGGNYDCAHGGHRDSNTEVFDAVARYPQNWSIDILKGGGFPGNITCGVLR